MVFASGVLLGQYEVKGLIGAGGMGEVYRARDSRLGRDVAIKVLPATLSADPDRLRRFEQEARAAGMLNHPNVLVVYDLGRHGTTDYIVSELLEGGTLRDRLASGPLPVRRAVEYALQTASGLSAAHAKHIVHRDLKPENLFVTEDGRVKILDFGIAKLTPGDGPQTTEMSTVQMATEPGMLMGTVSYMSPEQVRGQPVDSRSDLFSFGAILYEMIAGRRAFQRETAAETMTAILNDEPADLPDADQKVPPVLRRIVQRCLEKRPGARFQSASDLAFALESMSGITTSTSTPVTVPAARRHWVAMLVAGVFATAALAGGGVTLQRWGFRAGEARARARAPSYHQLTFRRGFVESARFASDGQTIVYAASWDGRPLELFSTRADSLESRSLGLPSASILAISRAGELAISMSCRPTPVVIVRGCRGTLARVPLAGGSPREVATNVLGADFLPGSSELAIVRAGASDTTRLEKPAGRVLYETPSGGTIYGLRVSPDGNRIAYVEEDVVGDRSLWVIDSVGKRDELVRSGGFALGALAWSPRGDEVWYSNSSAEHPPALFAVTLSGEKRLLERSTGFLNLFDVSPDGRLLTVSGPTQWVRMFGQPPGETSERELTWLRPIDSDLSADGRTLLLNASAYKTGGGNGIYLRGTDGSTPLRLEAGLADGFALSPDGTWAMASTVDTPRQLKLLPTGAGESRVLPSGGIVDIDRPVSWFPDGRRILFRGRQAGHRLRSFVQDIDGHLPEPVTEEGVEAVLISPDGTRLATVGSDAPAPPALLPLDGTPSRRIPGLEDGDRPLQWSADGRTLYVRAPGGFPATVFRVDIQTGRRELWRSLMPSDASGLVNIGTIHVTPDGRAYVYHYSFVLSDLYLAQGIE